MPLNPLNHHYAMENPASVYDEEALTALELAGRTTAKVNETVQAFNELEAQTNAHLDAQDKSLPGMTERAVQSHINGGTFDASINRYLGNLEDRVNNLVSQYNPGSTTGDAELLDMRVGSDGTTYASAGEALRHYLQAGGLVETSNWATKMPDANNIRYHSAFILHFADGTTDIPAHLPYKVWDGRIAALITIPGTYVRQIYLDDNVIFTRNSSRVDYWTEWKPLGKPEYVIDVNGGGDFASILKALQAHPTNTRFIVKTGVYDINLEYTNVYGSAYFENYTGYRESTDVMDRGLFLGDGVELIGQGRVELMFTYAGGNDNVKQYFSVLNTSQNNVVDGIDITITDDSCRYLVHDDFATAGGTNVFRNMVCIGHSHLSTALGGGFGVANTYIIENCTFKDTQGGISVAYHNNVGDGKNKLIMAGCDCSGSVYLKHYGTSVQKSRAEVFNCRATDIVLAFGDAETYPNANIELVAWHNNQDKKSDIVDRWNLFNEAEIMERTYIRNTGEKVTPAVDFFTFRLPVKANTVYDINTSGQLRFITYWNGPTLLGGVDTGGASGYDGYRTTPANCDSMCVTCYYTGNAMSMRKSPTYVTEYRPNMHADLLDGVKVHSHDVYGFDLATTEVRRPTFTFIFDDGCTQDKDVVNIFKKNGYACGFALVSNMVNDVRKDEYLEYQKHGFSILSHSTDGEAMNGDNIGNANWRMLASKDLLTKAGFSIRGWVTPSSQLHNDYLRFTRLHYDFAFTQYWDESTATGPVNHTKADDMYKLHRRYLGTALANLQAVVDETITNGGCTAFYYHSRDFGTDITLETLDALLQYIKAKEGNGLCIVLAPNEAIPYFFRVRHQDYLELLNK